MNEPNLHSEQDESVETSPGFTGHAAAVRREPAIRPARLKPPRPAVTAGVWAGRAATKPHHAAYAPHLTCCPKRLAESLKDVFQKLDFTSNSVFRCWLRASARHVGGRAMRSVRNHDDPISLAVEKVHAGLFSHWNPSQASVPFTGPN